MVGFPDSRVSNHMNPEPSQRGGNSTQATNRFSPALFCCILNFEATESEECFGCCFPNQGQDHGGNMVGVHPKQRVERVVSRRCCTSLVSDGRKQSHDGSERTWSDESALAFSFPFWPALDHLPLDQDQENHLCFLHYFILKYVFIYLSDFLTYVLYICNVHIYKTSCHLTNIWIIYRMQKKQVGSVSQWVRYGHVSQAVEGDGE